MSRAFTITPSTPKIELDLQGRAQVAYTVSNSSGKALKGWPKVGAGSKTDVSWFILEPGDEQTFAPGESRQFSIQVVPPKEIAPGPYSFRLNVISGSKGSDEESTEGPAVSFEIKGKGPAPKKFQWWIVFVLGGILLIGGIAILVLVGGTTKVPSVVGMTLEEATNRLDEASLTVKAIQSIDAGTNQVGTIAAQSPSAESPIPADKSVTLTVRGKNRLTPSVLGQTLDQTTNTLAVANLRVESVDFGDTGTNQVGTVSKQDPAPDSPVPAQGGVKVTVRTQSQVKVPRVIGIPFGLLDGVAGDGPLEFVEKSRQITGKVAADVIIEQNPTNGVMVAAGSRVEVVVEAESVLVPNVLNIPLPMALAILRTNHLTLGALQTSLTPVDRFNLFVRGQIPAAGTRVELGKSVDLRIVTAASADLRMFTNGVVRSLGRPKPMRSLTPFDLRVAPR